METTTTEQNSSSESAQSEAAPNQFGIDTNAKYRDSEGKYTGKLFKPDVKQPEYEQLVEMGAISHIDGKETKALGAFIRRLISEKYDTFVTFETRKSANPEAKAAKQADKLSEILAQLPAEEQAKIISRLKGE